MVSVIEIETCDELCRHCDLPFVEGFDFDVAILFRETSFVLAAESGLETRSSYVCQNVVVTCLSGQEIAQEIYYKIDLYSSAGLS